MHVALPMKTKHGLLTDCGIFLVSPSCEVVNSLPAVLLLGGPPVAFMRGMQLRDVHNADMSDSEPPASDAVSCMLLAKHSSGPFFAVPCLSPVSPDISRYEPGHDSMEAWLWV